MAPLARFVLPGIPHHVTQRGNGRQQVFFGKDDYAAYRDLLAAQCAAHGVAVWSRVLMPGLRGQRIAETVYLIGPTTLQASPLPKALSYTLQAVPCGHQLFQTVDSALLSSGPAFGF